MKKSPARSLHLKTETVRALDRGALAGAAGASAISYIGYQISGSLSSRAPTSATTGGSIGGAPASLVCTTICG